MTKKHYIAPVTESIELCCAMNILASSNIHVDEDDRADQFDAPRQRGEWGNLWK